jgi:hypothetical protein
MVQETQNGEAERKNKRKENGQDPVHHLQQTHGYKLWRPRADDG